MDPRELARRVLERVESQGAFASSVLDEELATTSLSDRDRALATELVYGVLRHRSRLDRALEPLLGRGRTSRKVLTVLRVAAYQLLLLDRVPAHAAVDDAAAAARELGGEKLAGFVNGLLRRLATTGEPALPPISNLRKHLAALHSMPAWLLGQLGQALPNEELAAATAAFAQTPRLAIRVDTRRIERDALAARLQREHPGIDINVSPHAPAALLVRGLGSPDRAPSFAEGLWTVQDVGAQMIAELAAPAAGMRILDACAGVGGKALHLAALAGEATIVCADVSAAKLARLQAAAARMGVTGLEPRLVDFTDPAAATALGRFDVVLLDAPCTGLGVLRRHPEAKWRVSYEDVGRMAALQAQLLEVAAGLIHPGGVLLYSVCTFTAKEGPEQIAALRKRAPQLELEAELRLWPHRHEADAFYAARLRA